MLSASRTSNSYAMCPKCLSPFEMVIFSPVFERKLSTRPMPVPEEKIQLIKRTKTEKCLQT